MFASACECTLHIIMHAHHEQGVICVPENLSRMTLEITLTILVVHRSVNEV